MLAAASSAAATARRARSSDEAYSPASKASSAARTRASRSSTRARWRRARWAGCGTARLAYHRRVPAPSPLLAASSLRVDVGGSPAVDGLTLATTGDRVLVLGAARALFEAAAGLR